jgi:hypothetical protein
MKINKLHAGEITMAIGIAIAAAITVHIFLYSPKANIRLEFSYEHHGDDFKPVRVETPK